MFKKILNIIAVYKEYRQINSKVKNDLRIYFSENDKAEFTIEAMDKLLKHFDSSLLNYTKEKNMTLESLEEAQNKNDNVLPQKYQEMTIGYILNKNKSLAA